MGQTAPDEPAESETPAATAEQAFADAQALYGPPAPEPEVPVECSDGDPGVIVVCAPLEEQSQFRVPSSSDGGDNSLLGWDGTPPDVGTKYPGAVAATGCFIPPCPPPPVYYFDITALPEPPPGSDADKIAKGETPE